jgi:hypothetical protein
LVVHAEGGTLGVFDNRVLRRIFEPKGDEVTGEWRRLHNKELYALYSSPNIIRVIKSKTEMGRTCSAYGERRGAYRILVGKPEGRRPLGRLRRRPHPSWAQISSSALYSRKPSAYIPPYPY